MIRPNVVYFDAMIKYPPTHYDCGITTLCTYSEKDRMKDWLAEDIVDCLKYLFLHDYVVSYDHVNFLYKAISNVLAMNDHSKTDLEWYSTILERSKSKNIDLKIFAENITGRKVSIDELQFIHCQHKVLSKLEVCDLWKNKMIWEVLRECRDTVYIIMNSYKSMYYHGHLKIYNENDMCIKEIEIKQEDWNTI
jgi:hypothetical protein